MGRPYSQDLRDRVMRAVDEGNPVYELADVFGVSVSYIYKALEPPPGYGRDIGAASGPWSEAEARRS